jgi:RNA polymerase sigma factor (sigma-70 family)
VVFQPSGSVRLALGPDAAPAVEGSDVSDVELAFQQACESEFRRVYGYVRYCVGNQDTADDLTAQAFLKALDRLSTFNAKKGPIETWILSVARNVVRDYWRSQRRWLWRPLENELNRPAPEPNPETCILETEQRERLLNAIRALSRREREVLGFKFAAGLTNRAIAGLMGLSENHVGVIVYRAIGTLRNRFVNEEERHA